MLDKLNHFAEAAATSVSRRQVLGRFGRAAAVAAAALAGLLPSQAEAARPLGGGSFCTQCGYDCPDGSSFGISRKGRHCPKEIDGCILVYQETVRCGSES